MFLKKSIIVTDFVLLLLSRERVHFDLSIIATAVDQRIHYMMFLKSEEIDEYHTCFQQPRYTNEAVLSAKLSVI